MIRTAAMTAATLLALLPQLALAQEGDKPWKSNVELGYVSTDGNSETSTLKVRATAAYESESWRNDTQLEALNSEEGSERSAERYFASNKTGYKFSETNYVFGYLSYEDDRFSGYDWQGVVAAGFGYRALETETLLWDLEAGPGYRYSKVQDSTLSDDEEELILRAYTNFEWKISDSATFQQELSSEIGQDKTVSRSDTSLKSTIIGALAMKLSYTVRYTDNVPPGTRHADTETAVTLVYSF